MSVEMCDLRDQYAEDFSGMPTGKLLEDTTEFMGIDSGDALLLGGKHYLVLRDECERRFGMEDPKFWVKRCRELETGERRILKLVFYERFPVRIGNFELICYRSPRKEARILDLVRGDLRFMQGITVQDVKGNLVRVLDVIRGKRLDEVVEDLEVDHETYVSEHLPKILHDFCGACEAIGFLHAHGEKHGDIRRDHLWVEHGSKRYRWIDFDYTFDFQEHPYGLDLLGLGHILTFLVGKGEITRQKIQTAAYGPRADLLDDEDYGLIFPNRLTNLIKLFPYIPQRLGRVLQHFAHGTEVFYESVGELLDDLGNCA